MTQQAPGYQAVTQETPRVLVRGKLEFFVYEFFYDNEKTQPVIPLDPQQYPNYRIYSPSGALLVQGTAQQGPLPGIWKISWVVPKNAELTNVLHRYRFQSVIVDQNMRQFEVSFHFDMVEDAVPPQAPRLQQYMTFSGKGLRLFFENTVRPAELAFTMVPRGNDSCIVHAANFVFPIPDPPGPNNIREVQIDTHFTYYVDTPNLYEGAYSAIWTVRDGVLSPQDYEHQVVQVVSTNTMHMINKIRMYLDKLQKKLGLVYAYTNEDLLEYLTEGMSLVNGYYPPTGYSISQYPGALESYIVMSSLWWGLTAQRILYAETNFSFSGQTVTLDYNPGADIDGVLSSLKETLDSRLSATKKDIVRASSAVGSLSTRSYRGYRTQQTFLINQGKGPTDLHNLFRTLGVLE